jgi:DNA-binding GntR family transcriptional regulator
MIARVSKSIEKAGKISASQKVEDYIKQAVYQGQLRPRERIIEGDIARHLGVSRGPVREAILRLERDGWIVTTTRRGTFIRDISPQEAEVIFHMRGKLEGLAVRYMRETMTAQHRAALHECLRKMKAAVAKKDHEQFFYLDMELHRTVWRLSGRSHLFLTINSIMNPFIFMIARTYSAGIPLAEQYEGHEAYVEMILNSPPGSVEREVDQYFDRLSRRLLAQVMPTSHLTLPPQTGPM